MRIVPTPPHPELDKLLALARTYVMTPAERFEQKASFVYGQMRAACYERASARNAIGRRCEC